MRADSQEDMRCFYTMEEFEKLQHRQINATSQYF